MGKIYDCLYRCDYELQYKRGSLVCYSSKQQMVSKLGGIKDNHKCTGGDGNKISEISSALQTYQNLGMNFWILSIFDMLHENDMRMIWVYVLKSDQVVDAEVF